MWRYYPGARYTTSDYPTRLTIKELKRIGIFNQENNERSWLLIFQNKFFVCFKLFLREKIGSLDISLTTRNKLTGEIKDVNYQIMLMSTECNFWGKRWWFVCPLGNNRCTILYLQNNWLFGSRKTLNLCYEAQKESHAYRYMSYIFGRDQAKWQKIYESIKYPYRNGKPTKKLLRAVKLLNKWPSIDEIMHAEERLFR